MTELHLRNNLSTQLDYSIEGKTKKYTDWLVYTFLGVYLSALILFFPPSNILSIFLLLYCFVFILLIIYSPKWWLWAAIVTICTLGFIPNLFGAYNKDVIDGSLFSLSQIQQVQSNGIKGRVISLPLLGLPPSLFIWWIRQKKVFLPRPFIPIAVFCILMIVSSIIVWLNYMHISFVPFDVTFITPEFLEKLPYARKWWITGGPFTLMAFTITLTFATFMGSVLLLCGFNLLRNTKWLDISFSALTLSTLISAGYGLAQMKGLVPVFTPGGSLESTFQSQGSYGVFVGISCVFLFNRLFLTEKRMIINVVLFAVSLLGLFINQTRTALLALVINTVVIYAGYLILRYKGSYILKGTKKWLLLTIIIGILVSAFTLSIPKVNHYIADNCRNLYITSTVQSFDFEKGLDSISSGRLHIWSKCLDIWKDKPLWGCGQGQLYWELKIRDTHDTAANQFLLVLAEMGIVGFIIFLWVIVSIFRHILRPLFIREAAYDYSNWLICFSLVVCIVVQSFTVHVLHFPNLPLLIGIIIAMALASIQHGPNLSEK